MGFVLSRFRMKPTTKELLEQIEQELDEIEDFRFSTQQHQRRWVGRLIVISVITYLIFALLFFLYFFPSEISKQILYSLPLFIFPLIVFALKWLLHWYYAFRLSQNADQMVLLQRKKRKILKEVMSKETYIVAKEILEKYDPDRIRERAGLVSSVSSQESDTMNRHSEMELRRRAVPMRVLPMQPIKPQAHGVRSLTPPPPQQPPIRPGYNAPPGTQLPVSKNLGIRPTGVPLACPILPRQRGTFDRLVEFVVGDGPNNRYALVCRQCQSHNGMALREEFEYIGFRCCYCYYLNPARKRRPLPPKLPSAMESTPSKTSDDKNSGEESASESLAETHDDGSQVKDGQLADVDVVNDEASVVEKEVPFVSNEEVKGSVIVEHSTDSQQSVQEQDFPDSFAPKTAEIEVVEDAKIPPLAAVRDVGDELECKMDE